MVGKTASKAIDAKAPEWAKPDNFAFGPRDGFGYEVSKVKIHKSYRHQSREDRGLDVGTAIGATFLISNVLF